MILNIPLLHNQKPRKAYLIFERTDKSSLTGLVYQSAFPVLDQIPITLNMKEERFNLVHILKGFSTLSAGSNAKILQWKGLVEKSTYLTASKEQHKGKSQPKGWGS